MSAIADLQSAATTITTAINNVVTLINGFVAGTTNADDPQVEAVVATLQNEAASLNAAAASATAPPTPSPVKSPSNAAPVVKS